MSTTLLRLKVPCTELTKVVILNRFQSELLTGQSLNISSLNVDVITFKKRRKAGENKHRTEILSIQLNQSHSEQYRPNQTEAIIANAIEKKAREIVLERMLGAFYVKREAEDAINSAMNSLGLIESNIEYEAIRKYFYRNRLSLTKENLPAQLLRK